MFISVELNWSTKNSNRLVRMELPRLARCVLSAGSTGVSLVGILRQLFSGGWSWLYISCCSGGRYCSALGRNDSCSLSLHMQASPADHPRLPASRLHSRVDIVSSSDRAAGAKAPDHPHPATAFFSAKRRQVRAAKTSPTTVTRFPFCDWVSAFRLASAAVYSAVGKVSGLLGLGRYHAA